MDWNEIYTELAKAMDSLSVAVASPPSERVAKQKELFDVELQERPKVDEAARQSHNEK